VLDSVGVRFRNEELCFKLEDCPNEMTKKEYILVSRTSISLASSTCALDDNNPPSTKIRVPSHAMA
jgi:hypothetical protein